MNYSEAIAQVVVEAVIHGSRMVYHSDQRQSRHDFDLHYADGTVAAMEVTASVDAAAEGTDAAILSRAKGGPTIKGERCKNAWRVWPRLDANINRIREKAAEYLAALESQGIEYFPTDRNRHASVKRIDQDVGIYSGKVMPYDRPGTIRIAAPLAGGPFDAYDVVEAVRREALKEDNRKKLAAAGTPIRHLFVFIDRSNHRVWSALAGLSPPMEVPDLPEEITDVWAVGQADSNDHYVVWRASAARAWCSLGQVRGQFPNQA